MRFSINELINNMFLNEKKMLTSQSHAPQGQSEQPSHRFNFKYDTQNSTPLPTWT